METKNDVLRNPDSFLQIGDFVAASFFLTSTGLLIIALFLLFQHKNVPKAWKAPVLLATMVPLVAALNSFYRRNYWVTTQTSPVEFRFFDWFLTVPLMCVVFYYLLRPLGAKLGMLFSLLIGSILMIGFGYLGEAIYPEESIKWGIWGSIGFAVIIGSIMGFGYPKIFRNSTDPILKNGYLLLSLLLPIGWSIYPLGYMTVPGNIMEGTLSVNTVNIMYNIADLFNKGFLAICVYFMATRSLEAARDRLAQEPGNLGSSYRNQMSNGTSTQEDISQPSSYYQFPKKQ